MLDTDGQRPEAIPALKKFVGLTQVTLEGNALEATTERGLHTLTLLQQCLAETIGVDDAH